jgi:hypothetical protein
VSKILLASVGTVRVPQLRPDRVIVTSDHVGGGGRKPPLRGASPPEPVAITPHALVASRRQRRLASFDLVG